MINKKFKGVKLWKRIVAYLIDIAILDLIVLFPFNAFFVDKSLDWKMLFNNQMNEQWAVLTFFMAFISLVYWVVLEYKLKQTIGKMIMKIQVKSVTEKELRFGQIFIRNFLKPFSVAFLIDVAYMFIMRSNQRLTEKFSGTFVGEENEK